MLYPNFQDLVAWKKQKSQRISSSHRLVDSLISGNDYSPFRGQGMEFDSVREYVFGDDIRNIDWRVTARTGAPHLKLFREERERHLLLCLDMNATMRFGTRKTFKSVQAAHAAAILGWQGLAQQHYISACLFGDVLNGIQLFAPKRTGQSFCAMLKVLTQPAAEQHEVSLKQALQHISQVSRMGSLIYLISDFMEIDQNIALESLLSKINQRCNLIFIAINDRSDQSIASMGTVGFCAKPSEKAYFNTQDSASREAYTTLWKENRQQLHALTAKFKIPLIELTTESHIQRDLNLGLKTFAKRKKSCLLY